MIEFKQSNADPLTDECIRLDGSLSDSSCNGYRIISKKTEFFTVKQLADKCQCHENQVRMWIDCGILKTIKIGKCSLINLDEFERFIDRFYGYDISNINHIRETLEILGNYEVMNDKR